eukprot:gene177-195_t
MLNLGSGLFMLVKLDFLKLLLREAWCNAPVLCFAFACAMHITDVRPAIVRGIRTLLLVLMSWLLPVTVALLAGWKLVFGAKTAHRIIMRQMENPTQFVQWLRSVAPYVHAFRGKTFVVGLAGEAIAAGKLNTFVQDLSGLVFDPADPDVLWAAQNKLGTLFKLTRDGDSFVPASGWPKNPTYVGGTGAPDTEGITIGPDGFVYLASERNNAASGVSRMSILRYD